MTRPVFPEVPIEDACASLKFLLADRRWCKGVSITESLTSADGIDPRNYGAIPVLVVTVASHRDRYRSEIPAAWPDVLTGHPVLVQFEGALANQRAAVAAPATPVGQAGRKWFGGPR